MEENEKRMERFQSKYSRVPLDIWHKIFISHPIPPWFNYENWTGNRLVAVIDLSCCLGSEVKD